MKPKACDTCPYRRSTPVGIWSAAEYENLRLNDGHGFGSLFNCHLKDGSLCRGWLADQKRRGVPSLSLRMRLMRDDAQCDAFNALDDADPALYESIEEMIEANADQPFPSRSRKAQKLARMKGRK